MKRHILFDKSYARLNSIITFYVRDITIVIFIRVGMCVL